MGCARAGVGSQIQCIATHIYTTLFFLYFLREKRIICITVVRPWLKPLDLLGFFQPRFPQQINYRSKSTASYVAAPEPSICRLKPICITSVADPTKKVTHKVQFNLTSPLGVVPSGSQSNKGVSTVGEVMTKLGVENYAATVNGEPADKSYQLSDFEYVTLAPQVKGA